MKTNDTTRTGLERTTMRRAATGDREALRTLVAEHGQALFGQALRLLPTREEAEDALQDTMLHAMRYAHQYDERRSSLRTWLTRIVYTTCLRHIERRPVAQVVSLAASVEDNYTNLTATHRHAWFGDVKAKYKIGRCDLELQLNNLFDQRRYTRVTYSGLDIYAHTSRLRPRNILATVRFKLL